MAKIPNEAVPLAYSLSKRVHEKSLSRSEAVKQLSKQMNESSANDYFENFKRLMEGQRFTRTLNAFSMNYYLEHILNDYGKNGLIKSLEALKVHIDYWEGYYKGKVTAKSMRNLYEAYHSVIDENSVNEQEQAEIILEEQKLRTSKDSILNELKAIRETDSELVIIKGKTFKRNNRTIALIKIVRGFECQLCGTSIKKKDGSSYIEAAHIKAKRDSGCETLNNIILLCPNHHKEFDLGNRKVESITESSVSIELNGRHHQVNLDFIK